MKKTRKRLLMAGLVFVGLTLAVLWLVGVRIGHVRFLILQFSSPPTLSTEETAELHTWLREDAVHLKTVAAGSGFDDMQPLKAMIGDIRVVALGEAAHLNRDFYRVKHRMVEFLVDEMDLTVFAIEATFAGALELNDYIVDGNGTPESALAALVYSAWRAEAVLTQAGCPGPASLYTPFGWADLPLPPPDWVVKNRWTRTTNGKVHSECIDRPAQAGAL
jgi:hypothetical protein